MKSDDAGEVETPALFHEDDDAQAHVEPAAGLRISGAERVTEPAALLDDHDPGFESMLDAGPLPEMQPWTDEPTGQIPAVLAHDEHESPWASIPEPTWREESADWANQDATFEHAMLADLPVGDDGADRQPWSFDEDVAAPEAEDKAPLGSFSADDYAAFGTGDLGDPLTAINGDLDDEVALAATSRAERTKSRSKVRSAAPRRSAPVTSGPPHPPRSPRGGASAAAAENTAFVRIMTGVLLALVLLVGFKLGTVISALVVAAATLMAVLEGFAMFRSVGYRPATFLGFVITVLSLWGAYNYGDAAVAAMVLAMTAGTFAWYLTGVEKTDPIIGIGTTLLVYCWIAVSGSYGELLLNQNKFPNEHGVAILLGVILLVGCYDVAALFVGKRFGRHPMAPTVSPQKTWEGLVGGTVIAFLIALFPVQFIHPWTTGAALLMALLTAIVAPIGDLVESYIKRYLGLKDSGRLLPGHGGILDRVDGLLFMLPVAYFVVKALNLG